MAALVHVILLRFFVRMAPAVQIVWVSLRWLSFESPRSRHIEPQGRRRTQLVGLTSVPAPPNPQAGESWADKLPEFGIPLQCHRAHDAIVVGRPTQMLILGAGAKPDADFDVAAVR